MDPNSLQMLNFIRPPTSKSVSTNFSLILIQGYFSFCIFSAPKSREIDSSFKYRNKIWDYKILYITKVYFKCSVLQLPQWMVILATRIHRFDSHFVSHRFIRYKRLVHVNHIIITCTRVLCVDTNTRLMLKAMNKLIAHWTILCHHTDCNRRQGKLHCTNGAYGVTHNALERVFVLKKPFVREFSKGIRGRKMWQLVERG